MLLWPTNNNLMRDAKKYILFIVGVGEKLYIFAVAKVRNYLVGVSMKRESGENPGQSSLL